MIKSHNTASLLALSERIRRERENRGATHKAGEVAAEGNKAAFLKWPQWPANAFGAPNSIIRSALFGIGTGRKRRFLSNESIATLEGMEIRYSGERLNQEDFEVWYSLVHIALMENKTFKCKVTAYALLAMLGKTDTGKNRRTLQARIVRLRATAVEIKTSDTAYIGGLLDEAYKDNSSTWNISLNPRIAALFGSHQFTQINRDIRGELSGKQLAQWLHGFYSSHKRPFPIKVNTLHNLCGSEASVMKDFKKDLVKSLDHLSRAAAKHNRIFDYIVEGEMIRIENNFVCSSRRVTKQTPPNRYELPFLRT